MAGFPSLDTLPHTAQLLHHSVNVFQQDSRNQSVVLFIKNLWDGKTPLSVAEQLIGNRIYYNWPFLQEGMVVAVSDSHFRYEYQAFGKTFKVASSQHGHAGLSGWSRNAEGHESRYSKRFGVIIGDVDVLVHIRPLKGLKRLEDGSSVKDWEEADKETDIPVQLTVKEVNFEDERFKEQPAPPLLEEFPIGTTVFFLGEHAYGVVAQVQDIVGETLSVTLAFFPGEKVENEQFHNVITSVPPLDYYPSYTVASMLHMTGLAVSKITSSLMVILNDGTKVNLGLSLKFQGKGLKVLGYTKMEDRGWEYSAKAVDLLREYKVTFPELFKKLDNRGDAMMKASDLFPGADADKKVKEIKAWLADKGVKDLEPVPLSTETFEKETIEKIEALANSLSANRSTGGIKRAKVQGIPRKVVLKPAHVASKLQDQEFKLGDRVIMVQDSGGVPLCHKGVVVGLLENMIDVVWDNAFIGGTKLGGRCSEYRGATCSTNSCLNLTNRQFVVSTASQPASQPVPVHLVNAYNQRSGSNTPRGGHFNGNRTPPIHHSQGRGRGSPTPRIMTNPNRGRGGGPSTNGNPPANQAVPNGAPIATSNQPAQNQDGPLPVNLFHSARGRGFRGRGPVSTRGRGGLQHPIPQANQASNERGRSSPRGNGLPDGSRARGRGGRGGNGGNAQQRGQSPSTTVPS
ncbi:hypothetical protein CPB86DRAFT_715030 [Serendipita vermifera]|nr:hypothetical protein CPB86DRAFT_715030 [Serendipita vermifera]